MKAKIKSNKLKVGHSITVEILKPVRKDGKPTHDFVFSTTLKTRLWEFGKLSPSAKKQLYEFWHYLELHIADATLESRDRIIEQVEAVIPRLSADDYADEKAKAERVAAERDEWLKSPDAKRMRLEMEREDALWKSRKPK